MHVPIPLCPLVFLYHYIFLLNSWYSKYAMKPVFQLSGDIQSILLATRRLETRAFFPCFDTCRVALARLWHTLIQGGAMLASKCVFEPSRPRLALLLEKQVLDREDLCEAKRAAYGEEKRMKWLGHSEGGWREERMHVSSWNKIYRQAIETQ